MHACLAQTFFCLIASLVLMTSKGWQKKVELEAEDRKHLSLRKIGVLTTAAIYLAAHFGCSPQTFEIREFYFMWRGRSWSPSLFFGSSGGFINFLSIAQNSSNLH